MGTAILRLDTWSLAWRGFWTKFAPPCGHSDCLHTQSMWGRLRGKTGGVVMQGVRYCRDECLERALSDAVRRIRQASPRPAAPHRVPLGLLLLSRQQLTVEQLRAALDAQRVAGRGKIGEWLLHLGYVSEQQVTAALARQWSCPVLRSNSWNLAPSRAPQIPVSLLESFVMIPVDYVEATATLHIAFGEGIDYSVLYAIEQMLGCHTESCMAVPSFVRKNLHALSGHRGESEVAFDRVADGAEFSRIISSYCIRLAASEIRLAACGPFLWVRLLRPSRPPLDLLLRSPRDVFSPAFSPSAVPELSAV
jgi:Type II secretion system (T2SS), protein E, N-terminal domain